jgi:hypothetical protein
MSNLRRKSTASSRELTELRRIIRESVADEIILGEGWRETLGIGGKKDAPVSDAGKDYAAGEGSAWQALYQISSDSTLGSIMSAWKAVEPQLASLKKGLQSNQLESFNVLVDGLKSLFTTPVNKLSSKISDLSSSIEKFQDQVVSAAKTAKSSRERPRAGQGTRGLDLWGDKMKADRQLYSGQANENLRRGLARLRRR